ncbi:hypothetical protein GALMADRAFT_250245 [Galerina marginata CBS 339.88]|uniref:Uncharacterized protein n=1 Tax=Galerina marginata (strain CBS 339.88) TaxID=685588 RepID=A0A067T5S5_GALM3|nr:hypothetical protein GALMADRAFT_250245 [Galerina marginata CBS 339.88]
MDKLSPQSSLRRNKVRERLLNNTQELSVRHRKRHVIVAVPLALSWLECQPRIPFDDLTIIGALRKGLRKAWAKR